MRKNIILLIMHLVCAIVCGLALGYTLNILCIVLLCIATASWFGCAVIDFIAIVDKMKPINLICPKCFTIVQYKNWFDWILHSPIHWFGKRYTECHCCGKWSYMKREK